MERFRTNDRLKAQAKIDGTGPLSTKRINR